MSDESPGETMTLPIEGAAALRQILGILSDHEIEDSDGRLDALDRRLSLAWNGEEWETMSAPNEEFPCRVLMPNCWFAAFVSRK